MYTLAGWVRNRCFIDEIDWKRNHVFSFREAPVFRPYCRKCLPMLFLPRFTPIRFGLVVLAAVCLLACEGTDYLDGTPPSNQKLTVSDLVIDTMGDSATGRTVQVRFRSSWEIDSGEFAKNRFLFGVELGQANAQWLQQPRTIALTASHGSRLDTLSCTSPVCHYSKWPVAHVLMQLPDGRYLSVADDSLKLAVEAAQ